MVGIVMLDGDMAFTHRLPHVPVGKRVKQCFKYSDIFFVYSTSFHFHSCSNLGAFFLFPLLFLSSLIFHFTAGKPKILIFLLPGSSSLIAGLLDCLIGTGFQLAVGSTVTSSNSVFVTLCKIPQMY